MICWRPTRLTGGDNLRTTEVLASHVIAHVYIVMTEKYLKKRRQWRMEFSPRVVNLLVREIWYLQKFGTLIGPIGASVGT
jgi:hypothetical protein